MGEIYTTTHEKLSRARACHNRHEHLRQALCERGEHDTITLQEIYDSNGWNDALWAVGSGACGPEAEKMTHLFACWCAASVLHIYEREHPDDMRPREAIAAKMTWVIGQIDDAARDAAWDAAWDAGWDAADDAARDAARAAARAAAWDAADDAAWDAARDAAWAAARAAAWDAARAAQEAFFCEMFNLKRRGEND